MLAAQVNTVYTDGLVTQKSQFLIASCLLQFRQSSWSKEVK